MYEFSLKKVSFHTVTSVFLTGIIEMQMPPYSVTIKAMYATTFILIS